ncbi:MAG: type II toxin-antitoxin system RelE/ParE family toxin [Gemmataceae bacterium]
MRFVETPVFTGVISDLLSDEEYRMLQAELIARPDSGRAIKGSGGLRKIRWRLPGRGKSGGCRVIYYWHDASETFYMLFAYPKNEQEDLTPKQIKILAALVREEFDEEEGL